MIVWRTNCLFPALVIIACGFAGCRPDAEPDNSRPATDGGAGMGSSNPQDRRGDPQDQVDTARANTCRSGNCQILLTKVVTLSDSIEPGILGDRVMVVQSKSGRIFTESRSRDRVLVFDAAGKLIKQIGRRGSGPGEFNRALTPMVGPGDTVFVPDVARSRLMVIGPDLKIAGIINIPKLPTLVLQDRTFIIADQIPTAAAIGFPIHRVDVNGKILQSFGTDTPQHRPDLRLVTTRVVSSARNSTVWAAAPGRYLLERWDSESGERLQRIKVDSPWFRESLRFGPEGERPVPIIERIFEDDDGLVWVLIRDADRNWKRPAQQWERVWNADEYDADHDWVLEVVDPSSQRIIATKRFPNALRSAPSARVLTSRHDRDDGIVAVDVWKPLLRPKEEP